MDAGAVFDALVDVGPGLHDLPAYLGPERREQVAALAAPSAATRPDRPSGPRAEGEGGAALAWPGDGAYLTGFSDPYLAADVARAANDWTIARCEAAGGFLYGSILVATHLPHHAAREIERCADHGLMRQVLLCSNAVGRTFGHSVYAPIHEAAAAAGLPIAIRAGAAGGVNPPLAAGGAVGLPLEQRTLAAEGLMTHLLGFVSNGVFERHPDLRLVLGGGGVGWLTGLLWRLDTNFKGVRRETPWLRRLPSQYVLEHVRLTTYPLEEAPPGRLARVVELAGGEPLLLYGSGSPNADADAAATVRETFPPAWAAAVLGGNARSVYGL